MDLTKQKRTSNIFITLINQWLPATFSSKVPDARPGKHTPPRGSRSPVHTWNSSGFPSFIVEMQKQNVSWDKTDVTIYSKYPHFRWVSTAFSLVFCSPHFLSWNTTHHMPQPSSFFCFLCFHHHNPARALRSCWGGYGWVCSYLRSGKKVWVVLNLPTAKVPLGENFADGLGVGL